MCSSTKHSPFWMEITSLCSPGVLAWASFGSAINSSDHWGGVLNKYFWDPFPLNHQNHIILRTLSCGSSLRVCFYGQTMSSPLRGAKDPKPMMKVFTGGLPYFWCGNHSYGSLPRFFRLCLLIVFFVAFTLSCFVILSGEGHG